MKFWPLHGMVGSDECMPYDLTKRPSQNRSDDPEKGDWEQPGRVIFPPGHENFPASNVDPPPGQQHFLGHLVWAADSRALLFQDGSEEPPGFVLITLDKSGAPAAFRRPLTPSEICGNEIPKLNE